MNPTTMFMKNLNNFIYYFGNFFILVIFIADLLNLYFGVGSNFISNDVNRPFISWTITIFSAASMTLYLIMRKKQKDEEKKKLNL